MEIYIVKSVIQFKNPSVGQPTKSIAEHYNGRRITAIVDGQEQLFRFTKTDLAFDVTEGEMVVAIENKLANK